MSRYIPQSTRKLIVSRAHLLCEYCLLHESQSYIGFELDHIISIKHGGDNELDNLAYACMYCNQNKGTDIGTMLLPSDAFQRFYNPRKDKWSDHFEFSNTLILPKTNIGEGTIKILQLNNVDRLVERQIWLDAGMFPHPEAMLIIQ
jgi:hypothetical protein